MRWHFRRRLIQGFHNAFILIVVVVAATVASILPRLERKITESEAPQKHLESFRRIGVRKVLVRHDPAARFSLAR
jgi:predicted MFS family arabinose efflux permease